MRKIRLDQIGDYSEEQINALLSVTVLTGDRIVKEGSPVDSGRLAVSWQIGENAESGAPAPEGKYGASGKGTVIRPPKPLNYQLGNENFRKNIIFTTMFHMLNLLSLEQVCRRLGVEFLEVAHLII